MKEITKTILGILATVTAMFVLFGLYALAMSMPDILDWLSIYIGKTTTWLLFIFIIGAIIALCVSKSNE